MWHCGEGGVLHTDPECGISYHRPFASCVQQTMYYIEAPTKGGLNDSMSFVDSIMSHWVCCQRLFYVHV